MNKFLLGPFSSAFRLATRLRSRAYETGMLKSYGVGVPVISIGNITTGGTGKTPTVDFLVKRFTQKKIPVGVVSRGYGAKNPGPVVVGNDPREFGDEPSMLAWKNPTVPVIIGRDRVAACEFLLKQFNSTKIILADDAFQHLKLKRDVNIVIMDATEPISHYQLLPLGRARETLQSLARADFVLINKTNLASASHLNWLEESIYSIRPEWRNQPGRIMHFIYKISGLRELKTSKAVSNSLTDKYFLFSGIGRSTTFKDLVTQDLDVTIVGEKRFADHYAYDENILNTVLMEAKRSGATRVLTTEKDAVKIKNWVNSDFLFTELEMIPRTVPDLLYEQIDSLLR